MDLAIVAATPHFGAAVETRTFLQVADFPDDGRDDAGMVGGGPEGRVGFALVSTTGGREFLKV